VKNELKFKEIIEKYEFKFLSPYNLVFNRTYLTNGYKEYGETVKNEIKRKIYEEPSGFFINDIVKFVNTIH
jgi:hypothetical protein